MDGIVSLAIAIGLAFVALFVYACYADYQTSEHNCEKVYGGNYTMGGCEYPPNPAGTVIIR